MSIDMADLRRRFREKQYKVTPQRQKILQTFIDNQEKHPQCGRCIFAAAGGFARHRPGDGISQSEMLEKLGFCTGSSLVTARAAMNWRPATRAMRITI